MVDVLFQNCSFGRSRALVVVRAGRDSLHKAWGEIPASAGWDLCAFQYGDFDAPAPVNENFVVYQREGFKYGSLWNFVTEYGLLDLYDVFWFPDDDIETTVPEVSRFLGLVEAFDLDMAQPALAEGSYISHRHTRERPEFTLRFLNFVEAMMPAFSRAALGKLLPSFQDSVTAWGLDLAWPSILQAAPSKVAIIDAVPMRHTRPVMTGGFYKAAEAAGVSPERELRANLERYGVEAFRFEHYGAILRTPRIAPWPRPRFEG